MINENLKQIKTFCDLLSIFEKKKKTDEHFALLTCQI